jgi:argininosuccinate synthase
MELHKISSYEVPRKVKKCVLLYSGGLDTSVMIKWIMEKYRCELVTLTLDIGQTTKDLEEVRYKALKLGVSEAYIIDAKKEFADKYISKAIKANALYEDIYPITTAIARPLKAKWAVKKAEEVGADTIAHGSTGKGNDQVRFEVTISALNPNLKIIAPVREWNLNREEEIIYAEKHGIPIPVDINNPYSIDENLWGRSVECGDVEYPDKEVPRNALKWCKPWEDTPNNAKYIEIEFEKGVPIALNGKDMELWELINCLNNIGGGYGVGLIDHMEDRIVGLKSREFYEAPAATIIIKAHKDLEKLVCTRHENWFKPLIDKEWTNLVYSGLWIEPLLEDLEKFIDNVNKKVSGKVVIKLFKGNAMVVARESPYALYDLKLASYGKNQVFNQKASYGFIELYGLQSRMAYILRESYRKEK